LGVGIKQSIFDGQELIFSFSFVPQTTSGLWKVEGILNPLCIANFDTCSPNNVGVKV
jgi:hypothetical protein